MTAIAERESLLIARIQALLPAHRVTGSLADMDDARRLAVPRAPEVRVLLRAWRPDAEGRGQGAGALEWAVQIADGSMRSSADRRTGTNGLLPVAETLRAGLAGFVTCHGSSPLEGAGGRLLAAGDPVAIWEERFLEHLPAAGVARPALATSLTEAGVLAMNHEAGAASLQSAAPLDAATGDHLVVVSEDGSAWEHVGAALSILGDSVTVERALSAEYAAGSRVLRAGSGFAFPVGPAPGSSVASARVSRTDVALSGTRQVALLGAARTLRALRFAPVREPDARALLAWRTGTLAQAEFLLLDSDGSCLACHFAAEPAASAAPGGNARLDLELAASMVDSINAWEVEP